MNVDNLKASWATHNTLPLYSTKTIWMKCTIWKYTQIVFYEQVISTVFLVLGHSPILIKFGILGQVLSLNRTRLYEKYLWMFEFDCHILIEYLVNLFFSFTFLSFLFCNGTSASTPVQALGHKSKSLPLGHCGRPFPFKHIF